MHTEIGPVAGFSWYLVIVNSRSEKKVAALLQRHGLEVFLPVERMKRQWSDRVKWVEFPLFAARLFCRCEAKDYMKLIHCPGVCRNPIPVPDEEMDCLKKVIATPYA